MRRHLAAPVLALAVVLGLVLPAAPGQAALATPYQSAVPQANWVPNGPVYSIAVSADTVYLGGDFSRLTNVDSGAKVTRHNLVALNRTTGAPRTSWRADTDAPVRVITVAADGTAYVGGDFAAIAGSARSRLAALDTAGVPLPGFTPVVNNRVWDLVVDGSGLLVAGQFTRINGLYRPGVARVATADGSLVTAFDANVTGGKVQALATWGTTLYLGGTFSGVGGQPRSFAAAVALTDGAVTSWAPEAVCDNCRIRDLDVTYDAVVAAVGGEPGGWATAWESSNAQRRWLKHADGEVQAVTVDGPTAFFGGHFAVRFGGLPRAEVAAVDLSTGTMESFRVATGGDALPGVWALDAQPEALRVGGGTALANLPYRRYLVFTDPTLIAPPSHVTVKLRMKGCASCKVRLVQRVSGKPLWKTSWKRASKGKVTIKVGRARTRGMSVQVRAPWEGATKATTEVVVGYAGKGTGSTISATTAAKRKKGSSCFAGTARPSVSWTVGVRKMTVAGKRGKTAGSRAWVTRTREDIPPVRSTSRGRLSTPSYTRCG